MWWNPVSEYEKELKADVLKIEEWFNQDSKIKPRIAIGFGCFWSQKSEKLVPVIVLKSAYLEKWNYDIDDDFLIKAADFELMIKYQSSYGVRLSFDFLSRIQKLKLNLDLHYIFASQPMLANSESSDNKFFKYLPTKNSLICNATGSRGSAGIYVYDNEKNIRVLTVAHVFRKGINSQVSIEKRFIFFRKKILFGRIIHYKNNDGWDVAVIDPCKREYNTNITPLNKVGLVNSFSHDKAILSYGSLSGLKQEGQILAGALKKIGNWKNVWCLAPSGIFQSGDSGSPVFIRDETPKYLGLYVGAGILAASKKPYIHYVQDGETILSQVLKNWDINY